MAKVTKEELMKENARLTEEVSRLKTLCDSESKRADDALKILIDQFCIEFGLRENTSDSWNKDRFENEVKSTRGIFAYVGRVIGERNALRDERAWLREMLGHTTEKEFQSERRQSVILKDMELRAERDMKLKFPG